MLRPILLYLRKHAMVESVVYKDFCIQTRPEIRKGCVWDVGLLFSLEALEKHKLKEIYLEKPRVQRESGAYLCLKVRSKLIQKEIGFGKVGELEHDRPYIEPNVSTGAATLKVKFMQRPRAVFHKHADVMVLVISLRSCTTNEVILNAEHELIFRGGTGSMHSADSRKKNSSGPASSHGHSGGLHGSSSISNHSHGSSVSHHHHHGSSAALAGHLAHASLSHSLAAQSSASAVSASHLLGHHHHAIPNASPYWEDHAGASYTAHHTHDHLSSGAPASLHAQQLLNGANNAAGKTTRSNRSALSLISATSSLPLPTPFARPSPSHFALSDAVTRAHPQSAELFPVSTKTPAKPAQIPSLLSTSEDSLSDSALFFQGNGTFFFDATSGDAPENQPHMEVQPLTLAAIQEFQIGLQEHCSAASLLPKSSDSTNTEEYDVTHSLSPTAGLTEDSSTDLDDTRELEAWAKSYGIDTNLFSPGNSSLDGVPSDATTYPLVHQEGLLMGDTNFLPSEPLAFNRPLAAPHSQVSQQEEKQDDDIYADTESEVKLEMTAENYDENAVAAPSDANTASETSQQAPTASASTSTAAPSTGIEGAITRGRAARIRGEHSRKRRAPFDPEDMPLGGKVPRFGGAAYPTQEGCANPAMAYAGGSFEDKVFQKLFFRSLTFLSLEELRALADSAPLPIFVKDEQGAYLLANPAFCSFIYDDSWDSIAHRSAEELLEAEESEPIHRADEYIKAREGNVGTFYLSVKQQDYKVMKLYTKLRDCAQKLVVGAVTF